MKKTLKINLNTHKRLVNEGKMFETFDDVINRIIDEAKRKRK